MVNLSSLQGSCLRKSTSLATPDKFTNRVA